MCLDVMCGEGRQFSASPLQKLMRGRNKSWARSFSQPTCLEHQHPTLRFRGRLNETSEKKKLRLTTLECCCGTCSVAFYSISGAFTSSRAVIYPGIQPCEYSHTLTLTLPVNELTILMKCHDFLC